MAEKAFAGDGGEQGEAESVEFGKAGEQRIVLVEVFAEAETGVEDDGGAGDARVEGGGGALA